MTDCGKAKDNQEKVRAYLACEIPALAVNRKSWKESLREDL
jgi:hypothetical protein